MPRMHSLMPARKVLAATAAATAVSFLSFRFGPILSFLPDNGALLVGGATLAAGYLTAPAASDQIDTQLPRPSGPQATAITAAS